MVWVVRSSPLPAAKGGAWLCPWCLRRRQRASKHSFKAAKESQALHPAAFRKCYKKEQYKVQCVLLTASCLGGTTLL